MLKQRLADVMARAEDLKGVSLNTSFLTSKTTTRRSPLSQCQDQLPNSSQCKPEFVHRAEIWRSSSYFRTVQPHPQGTSGSEDDHADQQEKVSSVERFRCKGSFARKRAFHRSGRYVASLGQADIKVRIVEESVTDHGKSKDDLLDFQHKYRTGYCHGLLVCGKSMCQCKL